ncbi:MAG: PD-(D/E)XK nuclease family protein [Pirellulaceae bacterium]
MPPSVSNEGPANVAASSIEFAKIFLGWDKPVLQSVAERLHAEFAGKASWDLRGLMLVLPSGLAGRRLHEILAAKASDLGLAFYPPKIVTVGQMPEELYQAELPFAAASTQQFAWLTALRESPTSELSKFLPTLPSDPNSAQWLDVARMLDSLHREIGSECLDFVEVARVLREDMADGDGFPHPEAGRWQVLADLQTRYLEVLERNGVVDRQTERGKALSQNRCASPRRLIAIGCVDLSRTHQAMLQRVADQVTIWVAAPEDRAELFDELGCLAVDQWQEHTLDIDAEQLLVGASPQDQVELAASSLARLRSRFSNHEITLGVPDAELIPQLKRRLSQADITTRYGPGNPLTQSEPVELLKRIGRYLSSRSYSDFAALVRHPVVDQMLGRHRGKIPEDWLIELDKYYQFVLPKEVDGFVSEKAPGTKVYSALTRTIDKWLSPLSKKRMPLLEFVKPLLEVLSIAYDRQTCELTDGSDAALYQAAKRCGEVILELHEVPKALQPVMPISDMIQWLVDSLGGQMVPEAPAPEAVEMLGWLELALDDAPALIVTGMHDGVVPESSSGDSFLPNAFRKRLGMMDNRRRLARDMYATQLILSSKKQVRFITGRYDNEGDPLTPSRILLACPLARLPDRVLHLTQDEQTDHLPVASNRWHRPDRTIQSLAIPEIDREYLRQNPPDSITVTAFRQYLACPYRYYLAHIRKLRGVDDSVTELEAGPFGDLVHDTLKELTGELGKCSEVDTIRDFLHEKLHQLCSAKFGSSPTAAVRIQIEQAEMRLTQFANLQAEHAAEGWEIRYVESGTWKDDHLKIGHNNELNLIGRIDRIDFHPESGQWAIWDYKTSEKEKNPIGVHWKKASGWADLQLPLYRWIAKHMGVKGTPQLGYISLAKTAHGSGFAVANFDPKLLEEADELANKIASRIAAGDFGDGTPERVHFDDYSRICQTQVQQIASTRPVRRPHRIDESRAPKYAAKTIARAEELALTPATAEPELPAMLIRASAGTGKTFQLSNRLLTILLAGQPVDHILATTFTRKAAGEILGRVLERLAEACIDETKRKGLASHLQAVDVSLENCLATLRRTTRSIHRFRISTLDSFFAQVARSFSMELGLPYGWQAMDPAEEPLLQMQAIGAMLENQPQKTLLDLVRMLTKGESTRRIAQEISSTVSSGLAAFRVTEEDDWDQLRIPKGPSEAAVDSALQTLEGVDLGNKNAREQFDKLHLSARTGNWEAVLGHKLFEKLQEPVPKYYRKEIPGDLIAALDVLAERACAELLPIRRGQTQASYKVIQAYDQHYRTLTQNQRKLAFSDVTYGLASWLNPIGNKGATAAKTGGDRGLLFKRLFDFRMDCSIQHLLLDEFQDTAIDQWRILEPLTRPLAESGRDPSSSLFCVGDVKQAIYGWRGGVAEIFDTVAKTLPNLERQELSKSYRSSPNVIESVNRVFQNLSDHENFADCNATANRWSQEFPEHKTALEDLTGYVQVQNGPQIEAESEEQRRLGHMRSVIPQIRELVESSNASVGVLVRSNHQVAEIMTLLREAGVPASQDGGNPLVDCAAVELILSLVQLADHPGDSNCQFHVATSPLSEKLGIDTNAPLAVSLWFRELVSRHGLGWAVHRVADQLAEPLAWWDQHRLSQLVDLAFSFQVSSKPRLRDFVTAVESQKVALPSEAQVKVMTIHKSKGLEFDAVFLPHMSIELHSGLPILVLRGEDPVAPPNGVLRYMNMALQRHLPKSWQDAFQEHKNRHISESLCLLYVAMTRAKQALYISTSAPAQSKRGSSQEFGAVIQSTLDDNGQRKTHGGTLYESGNADWFKSLPKATEKLQPEDTSETDLECSFDAPASSEQAESAASSQEAGNSRRSLRIAAPSFASHMIEPQPISQAFGISNSSGVIYGTLIHKFFEQVHWLEDFDLNPTKLRDLAQRTLTPEELGRISIDRAIEEFEEYLELPNTRDILSKQRYSNGPSGTVPDRVEVDNERQMSLVLDDEMIVGSIDRLVLTFRDGSPYAANIVDFKTDRYEPQLELLWLNERIDYHRPQLMAYGRAVSHLFQIPRERVSSYLLMLSTDDLVNLDSTPDSSILDLPAGSTAD